MEIIKVNSVFDHVEISLREAYGNDPEHKDTVFILGYNIIKNLEHIRNVYHDKKMIIIQLEQLFHDSPWWNKTQFSKLMLADEIWDYEEANVDFLAGYNLTAKHWLIPPTDKLITLPELTEEMADIDVLFYGAMNERRGIVLNNLQHAVPEAKIINLFNVWGEELDYFIKRSKIILNIHYYPVNLQEQVRLIYPVVNGRCVISERSKHNYMGKSIMESDYDNISEKVRVVLNQKSWLSQANTANRMLKLSRGIADA